MSEKKATNLREIYKYFKAEPVKIDEIDRFYVDTQVGRGGQNFIRHMERTLEQNDDHQHSLFIGYRGCGKSTELNRLHKENQDKYLIINFSIKDELNLISLNYMELFIVVMEKLFKTAIDNHLKIRKEYIETIKNWICTREVKEINEKHLGLEIEGGAEISWSLGFLLKFFGKFRGAAKTSRSVKEILKRNIEPKLQDLINLCNDFINEINLQLPAIGKEKILIIVEDLDKIVLESAKDLFFNHSDSITQLRVDTILTYPIALFHHAKFKTIRKYYQNCMELPMIEINYQDGSKNKEARRVMREIVAQRMEIDRLFESPDDLERFIDMSGGVLRDLFQLIKSAANSAMDYDRERISKDDIQIAVNFLRREYSNNIADYREGDMFISADQCYDALIELHNSQDKELKNTDVQLLMRENLSILGYNGKGWYAIHPLLKEILTDRGKI